MGESVLLIPLTPYILRPLLLCFIPYIHILFQTAQVSFTLPLFNSKAVLYISTMYHHCAIVLLRANGKGTPSFIHFTQGPRGRPTDICSIDVCLLLIITTKSFLCYSHTLQPAACLSFPLLNFNISSVQTSAHTAHS